MEGIKIAVHVALCAEHEVRLSLSARIDVFAPAHHHVNALGMALEGLGGDDAGISVANVLFGDCAVQEERDGELAGLAVGGPTVVLRHLQVRAGRRRLRRGKVRFSHKPVGVDELPHVLAAQLGGEAVLGILRDPFLELREVPHGEIVVAPDATRRRRTRLRTGRTPPRDDRRRLRQFRHAHPNVGIAVRVPSVDLMRKAFAVRTEERDVAAVCGRISVVESRKPVGDPDERGEVLQRLLAFVAGERQTAFIPRQCRKSRGNGSSQQRIMYRSHVFSSCIIMSRLTLSTGRA